MANGATLLLPVPKKLKEELEDMADFDWSKETKVFLEEEIKRRKALHALERLAQKSKLTEKGALELGRKVNKQMWEKHFKKLV